MGIESETAFSRLAAEHLHRPLEREEPSLVKALQKKLPLFTREEAERFSEERTYLPKKFLEMHVASRDETFRGSDQRKRIHLRERFRPLPEQLRPGHVLVETEQAHEVPLSVPDEDDAGAQSPTVRPEIGRAHV
jgi:hypothetical protein